MEEEACSRPYATPITLTIMCDGTISASIGVLTPEPTHEPVRPRKKSKAMTVDGPFAASEMTQKSVTTQMIPSKTETCATRTRPVSGAYDAAMSPSSPPSSSPNPLPTPKHTSANEI